MVSDDLDALELVRQSFVYITKYMSTGQRQIETEGNPISLLYTFRIGLVFEVARRAKELGIEVSIEKELKDILMPSTTLISNNDNIIQPKNTKFKYFDFQETAIKQLHKYGRGIFLSPTGSGKSIISYGVVTNIKEYSERTLIIVPKTSLVEQFYSDYKEYDPDIYITKFAATKGNKKCDRLSNIIVSNIQWLAKHSDELPKDIKAIIVDECHHAIGNTLSTLLSKYSTPYKLGMTATLPEAKEDYYKVCGLLHNVIFKELITNLQESNHLAKVKIFPVELRHKFNDRKLFKFGSNGEFLNDSDKPISSSQAYTREWDYLEHHKEANDQILRFIEKLNGNTIVIADHIEHIDYLFDNLNVKNKFKIYGDTPVSERENIRSIVDSRDGKRYFIIASSAAFAEGTNIKDIKNLAIVCHGKSKIKLLQSIGRSLRRISKDRTIEETACIFDFYHNFLFSRKHFKQRCKQYLESYNKNVKTYHVIPIETVSDASGKDEVIEL